jgi:hypothetical protein
MTEEIRQVSSFNVDDNGSSNDDELSTFQPTRNSLEIDFKTTVIPVATQSHSSILRMNSNYVLSNNSENLGLEAEECPAISKVNTRRITI